MDAPKSRSPYSFAMPHVIQLVIAVLAGVVAYWQVTQQWSAQNEQEEKYFWYATLMTETFEEVLAHIPNIESWIELVRGQVDMHCGYYLSENFIPELYSARLQEIVANVLAQSDC